MSVLPPSNEPEYAVTNPRTGERVATYSTATTEELESAIERAFAATKSWGRGTSLQSRTEVLLRVAGLHNERRETLAQAMSREMGKTVEDALGEVDFAADIYRFYAVRAPEHLRDEPIAVTSGPGAASIRRGPLGVLLGIMPWNFPAYQVARFAAPNMAVGNTILLKHAPQCPESAELIEDIFADAGAPSGAYVNIRLSHEQVEKVISDSRVQGVSLTGSERAGAAVAAVAGRNLKKVVLELGGSDPFLVLDVSDLDAVVEAAVTARMENTGQACNAGKRFIVLSHVYDDFVARFSDSMQARAKDCPPLVSADAAKALEAQLTRAVQAGAQLTGGGRDGAFITPGVLTGVDPDNPVFREELFGPVGMVFSVADEHEAVALANETAYGLGSYVFTDDEEQAERVADGIHAGMVFVNCVGAEGPELPFGGVKRSGFGRELGSLGFDEFSNRKLIRSLH